MTEPQCARRSHLTQVVSVPKYTFDSEKHDKWVATSNRLEVYIPIGVERVECYKSRLALAIVRHDVTTPWSCRLPDISSIRYANEELH